MKCLKKENILNSLRAVITVSQAPCLLFFHASLVLMADRESLAACEEIISRKNYHAA